MTLSSSSLYCTFSLLFILSLFINNLLLTFPNPSTFLNITWDDFFFLFFISKLIILIFLRFLNLLFSYLFFLFIIWKLFILLWIDIIFSFFILLFPEIRKFITFFSILLFFSFWLILDFISIFSVLIGFNSNFLGIILFWLVFPIFSIAKSLTLYTISIELKDFNFNLVLPINSISFILLWISIILFFLFPLMNILLLWKLFKLLNNFLYIIGCSDFSADLKSFFNSVSTIFFGIIILILFNLIISKTLFFVSFGFIGFNISNFEVLFMIKSLQIFNLEIIGKL